MNTYAETGSNGYLGLTALYDFVSGSRYEQKYFDTGVVLIDADYLSGRE